MSTFWTILFSATGTGLLLLLFGLALYAHELSEKLEAAKEELEVLRAERLNRQMASPSLEARLARKLAAQDAARHVKS